LFKEIVLGSIKIVNKIFNIKKNNKKIKLILILLKINKGIIFWIDESIIKIYIELVFKIEINHTWKGATPNFINILIIINIYKLYIWDIKKKLKRKIIEAHLWTKKYFMAFSNSKFIFEDIIGKNLNMFNSNLNHIKKLELILNDKIIEINIKK